MIYYSRFSQQIYDYYGLILLPGGGPPLGGAEGGPLGGGPRGGEVDPDPRP